MFMLSCEQIQPLPKIPTSGLALQVLRRPPPQKEKVVVVMGATGTGKSRLSIDLAARFPAEIVNSDKIQIHEGLDITTNKITPEETCGVPHHLLGVVDSNTDFTASNFCSLASVALKSITSRGQLPIIVGGSNSFIEALVDGKNHEFRSNYECCFLWVDVSISVLHSIISDRVDQMVEKGLINEVRSIFNPDSDYSKGIRRAIGVPELHHFLKIEPFLDKNTRVRILEEAINKIKANTCKLACRQLEKIHRLKNVKGWKIHRLDATNVFRKRSREEADEAWDNLVAAPSTMIVDRFLSNSSPVINTDAVSFGASAIGRQWQLQLARKQVVETPFYRAMQHENASF